MRSPGRPQLAEIAFCFDIGADLNMHFEALFRHIEAKWRQHPFTGETSTSRKCLLFWYCSRSKCAFWSTFQAHRGRMKAKNVHVNVIKKSLYPLVELFHLNISPKKYNFDYFLFFFNISSTPGILKSGYAQYLPKFWNTDFERLRHFLVDQMLNALSHGDVWTTCATTSAF